MLREQNHLRRNARIGRLPGHRPLRRLSPCAFGRDRANRWADDVRLSDLEPKFTCRACGHPLALRVPDLDIFGSKLVSRDNAGWQITEAGREFLLSLETKPSAVRPPEPPTELDVHRPDRLQRYAEAFQQHHRHRAIRSREPPSRLRQAARRICSARSVTPSRRAASCKLPFSSSSAIRSAASVAA
jgi:hypothetical protein